MPPKKQKDLGKALVRRAKQDKRKKHTGSTGFHIADMAQSNNPLQSVTEANSMEEFMAAASLAERDFTAVRNNISFVRDEDAANDAARRAIRNSSSTLGVALPSTTSSSSAFSNNGSLRDTVSGTFASLSIPRRPVWKEGISADDLHKAEKEAFLTWRRNIATEELRLGGGAIAPGNTPGVAPDVAHVTPFEKNIEVWRQLWRVVERSDVLIQIVDGRNPLMFRCSDLELYVKEVGKYKQTFLLINKADFLTPTQRMAWARYFTAQGVSFAFFSAKREAERLEELDRMQRGIKSEEQIAQEEAAEALWQKQQDELDDIEEDDDEEDEEEDDGEEEGDGGEGTTTTEKQSRRRHRAHDAASAGGLTAASSKSLATLIARKQRAQQRKRDAELEAAVQKALTADDDDDDDDSSSDDDGDEKREQQNGTDSSSKQDATEATTATTTTTTSTTPSVIAPAKAESVTTTKTKKSSSASTTTTAATPLPVYVFQTRADDRNVGLDSTDPLYEACRVLNRDEFIELLTERFGNLPRSAMGGDDEASKKRRAENDEKKREAARAARREELRRRREMNQRMVEVGLGAHIRYGDERDARALEDDDEGADENDGEGANVEDEEIPPLMIGMVGYPNVGKSSTINALLGATAANHGAKRVAVASTPGKTKHFQTLQLNDEIILNDCPGLVFPSFISTREEMVVNGVLPIDQLRDHTSPMRLLCQRIPRMMYEHVYGLRLPPPGPGEAPNRQPTVSELLDTYCKMRGFMASTHAGPDHPRASRVLLKDYCEGRVVYAHPPPSGWALGLGRTNTIAGSAPPASHTSSSSRVVSGRVRDRVSYSDNVLLPSVQKHGHTSVVAAAPIATSTSSSSNAASSSSAATTTPETVPTKEEEEEDQEEEGEEEEEDDEEQEDEDEAADDSDDLDEEDLLAFARVVVVKKPTQPSSSATTTIITADTISEKTKKKEKKKPAKIQGFLKSKGLKNVVEDDDEEEYDEDDDEEEEEEEEYDEEDDEETGHSNTKPSSSSSNAAAAGASYDFDTDTVTAKGDTVSSNQQSITGAAAVAAYTAAAAETKRQLLEIAKRQPRKAGIGRFGKVKKGNRPEDPYNTEAAADAALRSAVVAEIASVSSGPASAGAAVLPLNPSSGSFASPAIVKAAIAETAVRSSTTASAAAAATSSSSSNASVAASSSTSATTTKVIRRLVGGATVVDNVPAHLRYARKQMARPPALPVASKANAATAATASTATSASTASVNGVIPASILRKKVQINNVE